MKTKILNILLFLLIPAMLFAQDIPHPITIKSNFYDFGKVREGKSFRTRIALKNISDKPISLNCARMSERPSKYVSCDVSAYKLNPADSAEVIITLLSTAPPGKVKDSFTLEIKAGKEIIQQEKIVIKANILPIAGERTGPVLLFENNVCNIEDIQNNTSYNCTFKFRNTGDEPLIIKLQAESDSIKLDYPQSPVLPGQTGEINARFLATGFGFMKKYITVTSNMKENTEKMSLIIKGRFPK